MINSLFYLIYLFVHLLQTLILIFYVNPSSIKTYPVPQPLESLVFQLLPKYKINVPCCHTIIKTLLKNQESIHLNRAQKH